VTPVEFIAWSRFFLRIPQLPRLDALQAVGAFDYKVERCQSHHTNGHVEFMHLHGNHANSNCHSARRALGSRHTFQKRDCYYNWLKRQVSKQKWNQRAGGTKHQSHPAQQIHRGAVQRASSKETHQGAEKGVSVNLRAFQS
jgi:hypothetical protein